MANTTTVVILLSSRSLLCSARRPTADTRQHYACARDAPNYGEPRLCLRLSGEVQDPCPCMQSRKPRTGSILYPTASALASGADPQHGLHDFVATNRSSARATFCATEKSVMAL